MTAVSDCAISDTMQIPPTVGIFSILSAERQPRSVPAP